MSGPKSSRYTITAVQLMLLREQMRKNQEAQVLAARKINELEGIHHNCKELRDSINTLNELLSQCEQFEKEGFKDDTDLSFLRDLCKEGLRKADIYDKTDLSKNLDQLVEIGRNVTALIRKSNSAAQKAKLNLELLEDSFRDKVIGDISCGFTLSFANIGNRRKLKENAYHKRIVEELESLSDLTIPDELIDRFEILKKKADEIVSDDYLENFLNVSIIPFVKECRRYDELEKQYGDDYRTLYLRYEFLAKELHRGVERIPFSAEAVSLLLEKIAVLEAEELRRKEEEYISQCIEEAMAEMNYSVVGNRNVTKKNGKHFRNVLYKFDEGTAVNVTYSSDGQITMELGGVTEEDRLPTEAECESLEEDMHAFCDAFNKIEKTLEARGIESKHISHLPPEAQFAQMINISDYEITEKIGLYEAKGVSRKKQQPMEKILRENEA